MKRTRTIAIALLTVIGMQFMTSCFGKFALVKAVYKFNDGLGGKDTGGRVVKSLVFFVMIVIPVYQLSAFIDWIILNLIEFWTGTNPVAIKEGETETQLVAFAGKEYKMVAQKGKMTITQLSGNNKGKETVLYFNADKSISVLHGKEMVKVADYETVEQNFASNAIPVAAY